MNIEQLKEEILELRRNAFVETILGLEQEKYIIGYVGKTVPKEIFYGFSLIPLPLDGVDKYILEYSKENDLCSIIDSTLTYATTKKCPLIYNAKLIIVDNSCPLLAKILKENLKEKIYIYNENLNDLKNIVKNTFNRDFSEEKFLDAVEISKKISENLENLAKTNIELRFLYEVEFYTQFIFDLNEKLKIIEEVLSHYEITNAKRKIIKVPRAIQILDYIDDNFKNYKIIEGCFCLGENFKTYKKSGYEFLEEKYNTTKTNLDISYENCPYDK